MSTFVHLLVFDKVHYRTAPSDFNPFRPSDVKWLHFKVFTGPYWSNPPF